MHDHEATDPSGTPPDYADGTDPSIPIALEFDDDELDILLEDPTPWDEQVQRILSQVEKTSGRERVELLRKAAKVLEERLFDREQALEALTLAWCLDPTDSATARELDRLAGAFGDYQTLLDAARAELGRAPGRASRIAILRWCSRWHGAVGEHDEARACLEAVLAEEPGDAEALEDRVALFRRAGEWPALAEALGALATAQDVPRREAELFVELGDVYREHLGCPEEAAAAYVAAIDTVPEHAAALARLDALYREVLEPEQDGPDDLPPLRALVEQHTRLGDYGAAVAFMTRLAAVAPGVSQRVELHVAAAHILEHKLHDPGGALAHYERTVELAPQHREAHAAVQRIQAEVGDYHAVARSLELQAEEATSAARKAELLAELARLYDEHLGEADRALATYERALEADPGQVEAAFEIASLHHAAGRDEKAFELLQPLSRRLHQLPPERKRQVRCLLGEAAYGCGRDEEAIAALSAVVEGGGSAYVAHQLVSACFRAGHHADVVKWSRALLLDHEEALDAAQWIEGHHMLGVAQHQLGDIGGAARAFRATLSRDPGHRPTLDALIGLETERERWEVVAELEEQLAEHTDDPEERVRILERLGDLCREKLEQLPRALRVYHAALRQGPLDLRILHRLLLTHQAAGRWRDAVEVLSRIQAVERRPEARAQCAHTAGVILRDELSDVEGALERFHDALAIHPTHLKAFAAIDEMLTEHKAWDVLERSYRRALKDVMGKGQPQLELQLWHNLGLIYRDRLEDWERAVDAFRMASRLDPESRTEHRILAELFTRVSHGFGECVAEHQVILDGDPTRAASYHALFELHAAAGHFARARAAAAALCYLGEANTTEQEYVGRCDPPVLAPQRTVKGEHWGRLRHPDLDTSVSVIFEAFVEPLRKLRTKPDTELGLPRDQEVDRGSSTHRVAMLFGGICRYFRTPVSPRLFICPDRAGGLRHVGDATPPATVCGATPLTCFDTAQLEFLVAHHLADHYTELAIRTILARPAELETILRTALHVSGFQQQDPGVEEYAERLGPLLDARRVMGLRRACAKLADRDVAQVALRWSAAAELTVCRAGLLLCRDVAAAASVLRDLPPDPAGLRTRDKIHHLLRFSVSETFFDLLESLAAR